MVTLATAINELENAGEVKVKLSMHMLEKTSGQGSNLKVAVQKDVCFVLDPPKESKRKKEREPKTKKKIC